MFNAQIFKKSFRKDIGNWLRFMIWPAIIIDIIIISIMSYNTDNELVDTNSILTQVVYGAIALELPFIYVLIAATRMVVTEVENGAITYVVASPVPRLSIIMTKIGYLWCSIFAGFLINFILAAPVIVKYHNAMNIDLKIFATQLTGLFLCIFMLSSIAFLASSFFNKKSLAFLVGGGVPLLFFILNIISSISDNLDWLKYLSLITLFDKGQACVTSVGGFLNPQMSKLAPVSEYLGQYVAMFLIGSILYAISAVIFVKKDLPL